MVIGLETDDFTTVIFYEEVVETTIFHQAVIYTLIVGNFLTGVTLNTSKTLKHLKATKSLQKVKLSFFKNANRILKIKFCHRKI